MCQSSVWTHYPDGQTKKIADDVFYVTQDGEEVVLRWFLAEPRRVRGRIVAVDAVKHTISLEASQPPAGEANPRATEAQIESAHEHTHPHPH